MKNGASHFKLKLGIQFLFSNQYAFLIILLVLYSCTHKVYTKQDYTIYNKAFKLDASATLRTDGVYVLESIWTNENGGQLKQSKDHRFYIFYPTGQCNLTLDPSFKIKTEKEYMEVINRDFVTQKNTLFQGYYKLSQNKIIIQSRVVPRQQFEYKYGYIKNDSLIIVKASTQGKGTFDEVNYTGYYKEYYVFRSLAIKNEKEPQW